MQRQFGNSGNFGSNVDTRKLRERWGLRRLSHAPVSTDPLPEGPYFLVGNNIHQAWKMYADNLDSLTVAVVPDYVGTANTKYELDYQTGHETYAYK